VKLHLDCDNGRPICGDGRVWNVASLSVFAAAPVGERCAFCQRRFALIQWPRPVEPPHVEARHVPFRNGEGPGYAVIDHCPFCGMSHTHGWGSGGRAAHCAALRDGQSLQYILDCEGA